MNGHDLGIREITKDEISSFHENGWVKLDKFLPSGLAAELLARVEPLVQLGQQIPVVAPEKSQSSTHATPSPLSDIGIWRDYHRPSDTDSLFGAVCHSSALGAVVNRLLRRDVAIQSSDDTVACKLSRGSVGESAMTNWHQDYPSHPFDRADDMAFWIALAPATPEHGTMRFLNGSHRAGPLGRAFEAGENILESNPWLLETYELSEPLSYAPGDATIHHGLVLHGAEANHAASPRWSYITSYFPVDTLYTGAPWQVMPSWAPAETNKPMDRDYFPVVYPAAS